MAAQDDLTNILAEDDALLEELVDQTAALNLVLGAAEDGELPEETLERTYLALVDTLLSLSKSMNPIGGFGKERLLAGLSILEYFEKTSWAVSTRITAENAEAFRQFIPEEHYDDVVTGRKQAIGALRRLGEESFRALGLPPAAMQERQEGILADSSEPLKAAGLPSAKLRGRFAAGAVVCSVDQDADIPTLRLEWIEVHENLRHQGIGNMLMALILEPFLRDGDFMLVTELPINRLEDEDDAMEAEALESFLDSWKIEFAETAGRRFVVSLSELRENARFDDFPRGGAVSLAALEARAESMVRDFFRKQNHEYDKEYLRLPFSFFDPNLSTCIVENDRITALFLVHRFENGSYRYEALRCPDGYEGDEIKALLGCAYEKWLTRGEGDNIFGFFDSEEGRDAVTDLFPELLMPMVFSGVLMPPDDPITTEQWDELRRNAGFSDEKIPEVKDG